MIHFDRTNEKSTPWHEGSPRKCRLCLTDMFERSCLENIASCVDKSSVVDQLVKSIARANRIESKHVRPIIDELIERERFTTSAVGKGLAFPHIRSRRVSKFTGAVGIAPTGIDLQSLDKRPTKLVFLILSPWDEREMHLRLLSRLVSLTQDKSVHLRMDHELCPQDIWQYFQDLDERFESK
jgi:mannitol/fructose-specific phosphotransferase system IIA component (Ntr-type)